MADFGVDNFLGNVTTDGKQAVYKFHDPEDMTNAAEITLSDKDLDGKPAETREATDMAYAKASKEMNEKRDTRRFKEEAKRTADRQDADTKTREGANNFLDNSGDNTTKPVSVDKDGTTTYNTANQGQDKK